MVKVCEGSRFLLRAAKLSEDDDAAEARLGCFEAFHCRSLHQCETKEMLLANLIDLYSLVVLGSVVVSWIGLSPDHPVIRFCNTLTEPVLAPIRSVIPSFSGLDFSPMVLLIGLQLLRRMIGG